MATELSTEQFLAKREHQASLARARSKKSYEKHKDKKIEYMKNKRAAEKKMYSDILKSQAAVNEIQVNLEQNNIEDPVEPEEDLVAGVLTQKKCIDLISASETYGESTKKSYISDIKRLFKVTQCTDLKVCFKSPKTMLNKINNSNYAINSKKQTIQIVVVLIDKFGILKLINMSAKQTKVVRNIFKHHFDSLKEQSTVQNDERVRTEVVPKFSEYLSKIKKEYTEKSKQYLVALLYSIFTIRDNFKNMTIIEFDNQDDGKNNFILFKNLRTPKFTFIINDYKTKKQYEKLKFEVTDAKLKKALLWWIGEKKLAYGNLLFGKTSLSTFVSNMHKQIGFENALGINFFRHMRVTEHNTSGKKLTFDERKKLADSMGHSLLTQSKYQRNLLIGD